MRCHANAKLKPIKDIGELRYEKEDMGREDNGE